MTEEYNMLREGMKFIRENQDFNTGVSLYLIGAASLMIYFTIRGVRRQSRINKESERSTQQSSLASKLLKLAHYVGLTDLSDDEVNRDCQNDDRKS